MANKLPRHRKIGNTRAKKFVNAPIELARPADIASRNASLDISTASTKIGAKGDSQTERHLECTQRGFAGRES
jgi:hypothetical protein